MNTFVVYDSQYGNTEQLAQAIAQTLQEFGPARCALVSQVSGHELGDVDLLVLGCPTQRWQPTPAMLAFLASLPPQVVDGPAIACFDTRFHLAHFLTGSAAHSMAQQIHKLGARILTTPESFFVEGKQGPLEDGELQRADHWARTLHHQIAEHDPMLYPM